MILSSWMRGLALVFGGITAACVANSEPRAPAPSRAAPSTTSTDAEPSAPPQDASSSAPPRAAEPRAERAAALGGTPWIGIGMTLGDGGVMISEVVPHSPAARSGIRPGDRLVRVAGVSVARPQDVVELLNQQSIGRRLSLDLRRDSAVRLVSITPVPKPDTEQLLQKLFVGRPAPDISSARTVQGSVVPSWRQLEGEVVVLEFWASWCVACRALAPTLNRWHHELGALGINVLGITSDPYEEAVRASTLLKLEYPTFSDETGEITMRYHASSLPSVFLIDKAGVVRDVMVGFHPQRVQQLAQQLRQLATAERSRAPESER